MPETTPIATQLAAKNIPHNVAAAFIGITVNWMWDLANDPNEAWNTLTLVQISRLVILLGINLHLLSPASTGMPEIICEADQNGVIQVAGALRTNLNKRSPKHTKLDWDADDIKRWLSDDEELADIPVPALDDICKSVGVDTKSTVGQYLTKLGKSADATIQ